MNDYPITALYCCCYYSVCRMRERFPSGHHLKQSYEHVRPPPAVVRERMANGIVYRQG